jgi:threonine/homoserine/homoserine lactone efflux protein
VPTTGLAVGGFALAVSPLVATPGVSLTLLLRRVGTRGPRAALPVVAGTVTGLAVHATAAGIGLAALVLRSSEAFTVVRLVGATYLVGLGIATWRSGSARRNAAGADRHAEGRVGRRTRAVYLEALAGNVLNVKAASIFLTLAPQFVDARRALLPQLWLLAAAQAVLVATWLGTWALVVARAGRAAPGPRAGRLLRRASGVVLVGLGVRGAPRLWA